MRHTLLACAVVLALSACSQAPEPAAPVAAPVVAAPVVDAAAETARLNAWFETKYEEELKFSPIRLTFLGRKELYDQLDDMSEQAALDQLAWRKATVDELDSQFKYDTLTDEGKLSVDVWKLQYERAREATQFFDNDYVFNQMRGPQSFLPTILINFHRVDTDADADAYIARIAAMPRVVDQLLVRARKASTAGTHAPKFALAGVIDQSRKVITGAPFGEGADAALWADLQKEIDALQTAGTITAERATELKTKGRAALAEQFKPAYERIIAWAEEESAKALENPAGVGTTQANGKAYYESRLRENTTTALTAEEIHAIGLQEVERIRGEMTALKEKVGFKGDLDAFFNFIDSDPQFVFPNTDAGRQAYIDAATQAIDNIEKELPNYFGTLPKADLVVKRVEAFREQPGAAQHYFPATPDGSRPGIYYAHLSDMKAMPKPVLEVIAYHEGLPGHHMQISIAQELTGVPKFRTQADSTAYSEGWGLYAEWLAKEMPGTYQDPYSEFGRLGSEMWRAIRLVVDTGMHAKGWTEEQAVKYFDDNSPVPITAIRSEVQRYLVVPGQATAYKIGMIKIQELRRKAETELGAKFDIKAFHDTVLGGGALPLNLLERRIDQWIASRKAA
jgi:uncharacterized protein (DUF885 family)